MASKSAARRAWRVARGKIDPYCDYCGEVTHEDVHENHPRRATVEDIVPLSKGGRNNRSNWALACSLCNQAKGSNHDIPSRIVPVPLRDQLDETRQAENEQPKIGRHYRMTAAERRARKCRVVDRKNVDEVNRLARLARLPFSLYTPIPGVHDEAFR